IFSLESPGLIVLENSTFEIRYFAGDYLALCAFEHVAEGNKNKDYLKLKESLFSGYSKYMQLSEEDIQLSPYFMLARKLITDSLARGTKKQPKCKILLSDCC
ncbi:hypothetical protein Ldro_0791, partial [Legionella drozanskii LLAP-1]